MKRLLIKFGVRIGDPFDWEPTPWTRLRLWAKRHLTRKANATCEACGYRGIRTRRHRWCPACHEDLGGELIRDRSSAELSSSETESTSDQAGTSGTNDHENGSRDAV